MMARGQESQMARIRKEARSMLIMPLIKEESVDGINKRNELKINTLNDLRHDASASKLLKIKSGIFIEQKELTIDYNTPTSRFSPNLNEAASYAA